MQAETVLYAQFRRAELNQQPGARELLRHRI